MKGSGVSRREFGLVAGGMMGMAQAGALTAQQVIERIQKNIGVPWRTKTVDTFKAGDPRTPVTGIATTFISTLDVLQRAAASGKNLIITHEPTFYNHLDETKAFEQDPVYLHKRDFIEKHKLVVWRFHDHWHMRQPDAVMTGLAQLLGWEKYQAPEQQHFYTLPETTLEALASEAQKKVQGRTVRVVGDPKAKVSRIMVAPGYFSAPLGARPPREFDVFVGGESTEWEGGAYAQDLVTSGKGKGMILLGHQVSEEPGMKLCAEWLKTFLPEVPVEWMPSGEPFWRPA